MSTSHFKVRIWPIILFATVLGILTFLIPVPTGQNGLGFHLSAALPIFNLGLFVPGVVLLITALSSFKRRLRIAYGFITFGFLLLALGTVQYPIIALLRLTDSAWATEGFTEIPFILGTFCVFVGAWLYARLVEIKKTWLLLSGMIGAVLVLMALATQLPHGLVGGMAESDFDLILAFNAWEGSFLLASAVLLVLIKRHTNLIYNRAMAWLFIAFCLEAVGCYFIITAFVATGIETWFFAYNVFLVPFIVSGLAWLKSAEAFHNVASGTDLPLISEAGDHNFFGAPLESGPQREATCIDVVAFLASLCSNPSAVDNKLDALRAITARQPSTQSLNSADQEKLAHVALDIEHYLMHDDPVRTFSRQTLRQLIDERYEDKVDAPEFWRAFKGTADEALSNINISNKVKA